MSTTSPNYTGSSEPAGTQFAPNVLDYIALVLTVIGGINWGLVGAFDFNLVAALFGEASLVSRIVYVLVGIAALYCLSLLARFPRRSP